jgi:hypothetical protein
MYGIIMTANNWSSRYPIIKLKNIKISMDYQSLSPIKKKGNARYLIGGTLLDWVGL